MNCAKLTDCHLSYRAIGVVQQAIPPANWSFACADELARFREDGAAVTIGEFCAKGGRNERTGGGERSEMKRSGGGRSEGIEHEKGLWSAGSKGLS